MKSIFTGSLPDKGIGLRLASFTGWGTKAQVDPASHCKQDTGSSPQGLLRRDCLHPVHLLPCTVNLSCHSTRPCCPPHSYLLTAHPATQLSLQCALPPPRDSCVPCPSLPHTGIQCPFICSVLSASPGHHTHWGPLFRIKLANPVVSLSLAGRAQNLQTQERPFHPAEGIVARLQASVPLTPNTAALTSAPPPLSYQP